MNRVYLTCLVFSCFTIQISYAQQNYSANSVMNCSATDKTGPSSAFLYTCNGQTSSCKSYLVFRSHPLYNSVSTISNLTSADPTELARINNVSKSAIFPNEKEVIVPVNCSCSGKYYYQANTSYVKRSIYDTYFTIANNTYQGLSTCNILMEENKYGATELLPGFILEVPLRCACPTKNQTLEGIKFLLTYSIMWGDEILNISEKFNVSVDSVKNANGFTEDEPAIYPFTTVLIPLSTEPGISQNDITYNYSPPPPLPNSFQGSSNGKITGKNVGIGVATFILLLSIALAILFLLRKKLKSWWCEEKVKGKTKWVIPEKFRAYVSEVDTRFKFYKYEELVEGSSNFSSENWLGGSVFRGIVNGEILAIKTVSKDVSKEVHLLSRINHFNLIHLHGVSEHLRELYLVFEFMENGNLLNWLQNKDNPEVKNLSYRIQIALDIANGLHYLHNFTYPAYVHKDISTVNILLDRNLRAKISNFSLARSADYEESKILSMKSVLASRGYESPEYIEYGLVTIASDIYAFGVVLLELITGKEAFFEQDGKEVLLSEEVFLIMESENAEDELKQIIDSSFQVENRMEIVMCLVKLSLACLAEEPEKRMKIAKIVTALLKIQMEARKTEPYVWRGSVV
ncbi:hypothetical protein ACFE04_022710 [Oxalis oulophora]